MNKLFFFTGVLCFLACTPEKPEPDSPDPQASIEAWIANAEFDKVLMPGDQGILDIVFNNGNAALLDNLNRVYFSYNNGGAWEERFQLSGNTARCIALRGDGEKFFIGGISLGNYTFGAKFWVYHSPKNGPVQLDYDGEAKVANTDEPINHDFMRASWNGDGSVYASFGRSNKTDGFFGNITPDGRKIFVRRTPSHSSIQGENPSFAKSHCAGFYIANNSERITLCVSEYIPSGFTHFLMPYYSESKGAGNSWLSLRNYWLADLVYHIGQDLSGNHAIYVSQANRLFYNGQQLINHKNLQGELTCASVDNQNFVWVGTSTGLYKSKRPLF